MSTTIGRKIKLTWLATRIISSPKRVYTKTRNSRDWVMGIGALGGGGGWVWVLGPAESVEAELGAEPRPGWAGFWLVVEADLSANVFGCGYVSGVFPGPGVGSGCLSLD